MAIIHFNNRQTSGIGKIINRIGGWPVIEFSDGSTTSLNPFLNDIHPANGKEVEAYYEEVLARIANLDDTTPESSA